MNLIYKYVYCVIIFLILLDLPLAFTKHLESSNNIHKGIPTPSVSISDSGSGRLDPLECIVMLENRSPHFQVSQWIQSDAHPDAQSETESRQKET